MKRKKILSLQSIRTIGFLMIYTSHARISSLGGGGVSLFLILSGFLLTYQNIDNDENLLNSLSEKIKYIKNSVKKFYWLHILTMISAAPFMVYLFLIKRNINEVILFVSTFTNLFLLQSWIPIEDVYFSYNAVSWYLSLYFYCVLAFLFELKRLQNYSCKRAIFNIVICFVLQFVIGVLSTSIFGDIFATNGITDYVTYVFPINRFGDFYIGCNLCIIVEDSKKRSGKVSDWTATLCEILVLIIIIFMPLLIEHLEFLGKSFLRQALVYEPFCVLLVLLFATGHGKISYYLSNLRFVQYIAKVSGSAFLIHQIVLRYLNVIVKHGGFRLNAIQIAVLGLAITLLSSSIYDNLNIVLKKEYNISRRE